jgi:hypothetical protein
VDGGALERAVPLSRVFINVSSLSPFHSALDSTRLCHRHMGVPYFTPLSSYFSLVTIVHLLFLLIVSPYCFSLLFLLIVSPYCFSLLFLLIVSPYCFSLLFLLIVSPYCFSLLFLLIVSPLLPSASIFREFEHPEQERPLRVILYQAQQLEV